MKAFLLKQDASFHHLLASMTYTHNVIYHDVSTINGVAWSLEVEVQFYLLAPLLAQYFRISRVFLRRGFLIVSMVAIGILTDLFLAPKGTTHSLYLLPQLNYFLAGFLLADIFATEMVMAAIQRNFLWDLLTTAAWILMFVAIHLYKVDTLIFPALIFVAYLGALKGVCWNAFTSNPVIFTIGGMCYTIYLWHNLVLEILVRKFTLATLMYQHMSPGWFWTIYLAVASLCVLVVCCILFALFERPFMIKTWPRDLANWTFRLRPGSAQIALPDGSNSKPKEKVDQ
jgi:peptidoglycan/LPS O-acetylase OafA/YrhL